MLINEYYDLELSEKETKNLIQNLMYPTSELMKKREMFFEQSDNMSITYANDGTILVDMPDLELSVFDEDEEKSVHVRGNEYETITIARRKPQRYAIAGAISGMTYSLAESIIVDISQKQDELYDNNTVQVDRILGGAKKQWIGTARNTSGMIKVA